MADWYDKPCEECGTNMRVCSDWDNPPRLCKSCRAERAAQWYEKACEDCGTTMRIHRDWDNPPRICKSCKAQRDAKWYEKSCERCGKAMRVNREWDSPPKLCPDCRAAYPPKQVSCDHCGNGFTISTGTQIHCAEHGWELPRKCPACRELFKHKPFKTVEERALLGETVYRTYNGIGQLISESRDETTVFGAERRRHQSQTRKTTGFTRNEKTLLGTPYRETTRTDGTVKSRSREETSILGKRYTESTGGSSQTKHRTTTERSWLGRFFRRTE